MKKGLNILNYGEAAHVSEFIQHIQCMINHEIRPKETFKEHFDRLLKKYVDDPDAHIAINNFIAHQPKEVLSMVPWDAYEFGDPEATGKKWHNFNLFDAKEQ